MDKIIEENAADEAKVSKKKVVKCEGCSDTGIGESLYLTANAFVFIYLAGKFTASSWRGAAGSS